MYATNSTMQATDSAGYLRETVASAKKSSSSSQVRSRSRDVGLSRLHPHSRPSTGTTPLSANSSLYEQQQQQQQKYKHKSGRQSVTFSGATSGSSWDQLASVETTTSHKKHSGRRLSDKNLNIPEPAREPAREPAKWTRDQQYEQQLPHRQQEMVDYERVAHEVKSVHGAAVDRCGLTSYERQDAIQLYCEENMGTLFALQRQQAAASARLATEVGELSAANARLEADVGSLRTALEEAHAASREHEHRAKKMGSTVAELVRTVNSSCVAASAEAAAGPGACAGCDKVRALVDAVAVDVAGLASAQQAGSDAVREEVLRMERVLRKDVWFLDDLVADLEDAVNWLASQHSQQGQHGQQGQAEQRRRSESSGSIYSERTEEEREQT